MKATADGVLDTARLDEWIGDRLPGTGQPLTVKRIGTGTGVANALHIVRRGDYRWVLRQPPAVKNHPSASNTLREWRILTALEGSVVPHPTPLAFCDDPDVLGTPFLIMGFVDGFTPGFELAEPFASKPQLRRDLAMAYVDGCADLSMVNWRVKGLADLGKPEGFLERQVSRWLGQLDGYRTRELPEVDFICDWLNKNMPTMSSTAIIHGDYSPFNVMVAPSPPARLAAIVDWDTGTIGDPLLDLGHLLARWTEPGERPVISVQAGGCEGYPSRAEMAAHYAERTGRDLSALVFYEVLALFKLAVILEGTHAREVNNGVPTAKTTMAVIVPQLLRGAGEFARGQRV